MTRDRPDSKAEQTVDPRGSATALDQARDADSSDPAFGRLLEFIRDHRGFDFTGYKRSSLIRRCRRRMRDVEVTDFDDYIEVLERDSGEFRNLFNTILINVTDFFRDPEAWEALRGAVDSRLLTRKGAGEPIRVWSAGCATGQEAYSLAIVLAEHLGPSEFGHRVKIFATDVDSEALSTARRGVYPASAVDSVPPELLSRYFERTGSGFAVLRDLRRSVIFGRHDIVREAPICDIDLIACRNTLMYFNAVVQAAALRRFHFALAPEALLFLGRAEMMRSHGALFHTVDLRARIFARAAERRGSGTGVGRFRVEGRAESLSRQLGLSQAVMDAQEVPQIVVSVGARVLLINRRAREEIGLSPADLGRPVMDLEPLDLPVNFTHLVRRSAAGGAESIETGAEVALPGGVRERIEIFLTRVCDTSGALLGVGIRFGRRRSVVPPERSPSGSNHPT